MDVVWHQTEGIDVVVITARKFTYLGKKRTSIGIVDKNLSSLDAARNNVVD